MSEEKWWINKFNSFLKKSKGDKAKAIAKIQDYIEKNYSQLSCSCSPQVPRSDYCGQRGQHSKDGERLL